MLPSSWVDELFQRFTVRYGAAWIRQWEGVEMALVKADWSRELGGFAGNSGAIAYALEHLPAARPLTLGEFRQLCIGYAPRFIALPDVKANPAVVAAVQAGIGKGRMQQTGSPAAYCIRRIDEAGTRAPLTPAQRDMRASCLRKVELEAGQHEVL